MKVRIETRGTSYTAELMVTKKSIRSAARSAKRTLKSILALRVEKPEDTGEAPDKEEKLPAKKRGKAPPFTPTKSTKK